MPSSSWHCLNNVKSSASGLRWALPVPSDSNGPGLSFIITWQREMGNHVVHWLKWRVVAYRYLIIVFLAMAGIDSLLLFDFLTAGGDRFWVSTTEYCISIIKHMAPPGSGIVVILVGCSRLCLCKITKFYPNFLLWLIWTITISSPFQLGCGTRMTGLALFLSSENAGWIAIDPICCLCCL